jgi:hypothetical protein
MLPTTAQGSLEVLSMNQRRAESLAREDGQSIIMVAILLVVLIALMALVLDVGNAYAQRRVTQNAADAAALAASSELARGSATTNANVLAKARTYAQQNGIDPNTVVARYFSFNPTTQQQTDLGLVPNDNSVPRSDADGVVASVGRTFPTYLAGVVGRYSMTASADASGYVGRGVCSAGGPGNPLFPIGISRDTFTPLSDDFFPAYGEDNTYVIWGEKTSPGNFQWLSWNQSPGHSSEQTLLNNLGGAANSGTWNVDSDIPAGPGHMTSSGTAGLLQQRINGTLQNPVTVPIYDYVTGTGSNATYHVAGFAKFKLTGYNFQGSDKWLKGYFVETDPSTSEGGCGFYGTKTVKLRPPMDLSRTIEGRLSYQWLSIDGETGGEAAAPVDVVLVMDTSGSMGQTWGAGESKIVTARRVLGDFAGRLRPDIGDQVAVVHFPKVNGLNDAAGYETFSKNYKLSCGNGNDKSNYRFRGETLAGLTSQMQTVTSTVASLGVNGGTPIADAMNTAFNVLNGPGHVDGHAKVVILASDGMTNVTQDGRWTGYSGNTTSGMGGCNGTAEAQAMDVAQAAKAAGVTVFTVAIGNDFSGTILQNMASPSPDPSKAHFFVASDPTAMQQIYAALGARVTNLNGECKVTPIAQAAADAYIAIYKDGVKVAETTCSDSGSFVFSNVEPGTYTFVASTTRDGLTYNVFTNRIGGLQISSPTVVVGQEAGAYSADVFLKSSTTPGCVGG